MTLKTLTLALATAVASPVFADEAPGATFDFQCVSIAPDGSYQAEFEHFVPLLSNDGVSRTIIGNAIGRHSEIMDAHRFASDQDTLQQILTTHQSWVADGLGTPDQRFMMQGENIELAEGIDALEESEELGYPEPACLSALYT